jgi:hypothetical protein
MTDRSRYAPIENEIREQLNQVLAIVQPYARSHGGFVNWNDLREAIRLAMHAMERAQLLADHRLPPTQ